MNIITGKSNLESCWNLIGISGDSTCQELSNYIHCRNCPVYSLAGRNLLERSLPENYQNEWTHIISQSNKLTATQPDNFHSESASLSTTKTITVAIFRLQREWLGLSAQVLKETIAPTKIHIIPHRSNNLLKGLVNIRGELQLCISLSHLLNLEPIQNLPKSLSPIVYARMIVIEKINNIWVFPVDEFYGLYQFYADELRDPPNHNASRINTFTKGFFHWESHSLSYIDDELLFMSLSKKVLL